VLAGRDVEAERLLVVGHHAVGAAIDPTFVGIARDVEAAGPDIAAAVGLMPLRRGKPGDVDVVPLHDVLEHRAVGDVFRRNALEVGHVVGAELLAQIELGQIAREAERHVLALAAEEVDEHAAALQASRDIFEDEAGRRVVVQGQFGHHADVLLPRQTFDLLDLAEISRRVDPRAQIHIGNARLDIGSAGRDRFSFAVGPDRRAHCVGLFDTRRHHALPDTCLPPEDPKDRGPAAAIHLDAVLQRASTLSFRPQCHNAGPAQPHAWDARGVD
jgi:hypothetical protein